MKQFPMLMDWYKQHSENGHIDKSNLHVYCNTHQNSNDIHHTDQKINTKVHLEAQKMTNGPGNTEQKEQCWRCHITQLQIILQSHSNKSSIVLPQKTCKKTSGAE
jgi:hypothetical protein